MPNRMRAHSSVCVRNEAVARRIKTVLREASPHGVLLSRFEYVERIAGRDGMPSATFLLREVGGWAEVARWAGLRPHGDAAEVIWKETRSQLVDLSYRFHEGTYGPSSHEWDMHRHPALPPSEKLKKRFITWSSVLAWAGGMEEASEAYYQKRERARVRQRQAAIAKKSAASKRLAAVEDELMREELSAQGLTIAGEIRTGFRYDWTTRRYYECTAATLR